MTFISKAMDLLPIVGPVASAITQGGPRRQYKWNRRAARDANVMNRENQQWLLEQNRALQDEQRKYDSPRSQMDRYIAAGLNPNMIYGSGSSAGQAFPIDAGSVPGVNIQPPSARYPDITGSFLGAAQSVAQTELIQQRTQESQTNQALKEVMIDIAKTNPMLQPWVSEWVATAMSETARLKSLESRSWMSSSEGVLKISQKVNAEIENMTQRLGLNTADLQIKNKIFESKEFENAIKQINAQWLQDGDMSPEHIRQGLMLILSKMIGK